MINISTSLPTAVSFWETQMESPSFDNRYYNFELPALATKRGWRLTLAIFYFELAGASK